MESGAIECARVLSNFLLRVAAGVAIVSITAAVYWAALASGFVGDDYMILHRLRPISHIGEAMGFFRGEFFEYYRPLVFVSHAIDWLAAGPDPRWFHATNLVLHLANSTLVFLIGSARAISGDHSGRRLAGGSLAAVLFALHASNHEAVIWIAARFDLLAAFWALAAVWLMVAGAGERRGGWLTAWATAGLFFAALLSKESVVALPIAAAAWAAFVMRATTAQVAWRTLPWLGTLGVYTVLRGWAGGTAFAGGTARVPKLLAFAAVLAGVAALGDSRGERVRAWLRDRRAAVAAASSVAVAMTALAAAFVEGAAGDLAREKLAVAGFGVFYLLSPIVDVTLTPYFLDPATNVYWLGGAAALALVVALLALFWRSLVEDDRAWFAAAFLLASLIPISALTEGKRYLYLPSAAAALLAATLALRARSRAGQLAVAAVVTAATLVSAWQISRKVSDWTWAGRMTAEGAALVDSTLAPGCGGQVVFLTSPVALRGVYTHFYYETFELARGCAPDVFYVLVRMVRQDAHVDVRWEAADRIAITAPAYGGNFVLSRDLRHFDLPLRAVRDRAIPTPIGPVVARGAESEQRIILTLDSTVRDAGVRFFYFSDGRVRALR